MTTQQNINTPGSSVTLFELTKVQYRLSLVNHLGEGGANI